jgi:phospholipase C
MAKLLFDHFVVLMLENRSFDHLFGYLGIGDGVPSGGFTNHLKPGAHKGKAFTTRKGGDYVSAGQGPGHTLQNTNLQLFGTATPSVAASAAPPPMSGFVASFAAELRGDLKRAPTDNEIQQVMNCFDPVQLPVLSTLAKSFVLCDRWFADVPGPTMPNRAYVHAATSQGYTWNAHWKPTFTCKTLYDRLNAAALSWRSYYHDQDDILELYSDLGRDETNHVLFEGNFAADVAADALPTYSFVTPSFLGATPNSMHAPADVRPAEKLVADVYSALQNHPDVWKKTLFVILFDEHGGYQDHVPPPHTVSPDNIPGNTVPFAFDRLGLRVPAMLISPWFQPAVDSTVYSHSTVPGSIIDALALPGGFLTARDRQANKLTAKYLVDDGTHVWRDATPTVTPPPQPQTIGKIQREILEGAVNMDPHPGNRSTKRTQDIQDPAHAQHFVRVQAAKRLEHFLAAKGRFDPSKLSAPNQPPSTTVSPSRISELSRSLE